MIRENFYNAKNQPVGTLCDKNIYRSKRKLSKHLLIVLDAWGVDQSIVDSLAKMGCEQIRIADEENGDIYSVSYEVFMEKAIAKDFVGPQLFLPRKYWTKTNSVGI